MNKIPAKYLEVLSDDVTEDLARAAQRISNMPMEQRKKTGKDLGETMVIAHAAVAAEHGEIMIILIDDRGGRKIATAEDNRLGRLRVQGSGVGRISLVGTLTVLRSAVVNKHIPDKAAMRDLYRRFRLADDGLPPLAARGLLDPELWV